MPVAVINQVREAEAPLFGLWGTDGVAIYETNEARGDVVSAGAMRDGSSANRLSGGIAHQGPVIDPKLLAIHPAPQTIVESSDMPERGFNHPPRNKRRPVQTADDLAAEEASKYGVSGSRRKVKRVI
jgi:hypothetical protein